MGKITITDKILDFAVKNTNAMDRALASMGADIERISKQQVPVSATKAMGNKRGGGGQLQSSGRVVKKGLLSHMVIYNMEYAAYQEWGQRADGSHKVKRYSTPGRKKFYLRDPGELIASRAIEYIKDEARKIKVNI